MLENPKGYRLTCPCNVSAEEHMLYRKKRRILTNTSFQENKTKHILETSFLRMTIFHMSIFGVAISCCQGKCTFNLQHSISKHFLHAKTILPKKKHADCLKLVPWKKKIHIYIIHSLQI